MQSYPRISIVTPSYNDAAYLEETILSVVTQGYPNLEYIVMDGGSTDGSVEVIKKYADRISYWVSEKDNGMYDAIQKGFERTTGEIMGWINSDDKLHEGSLFTAAQIFHEFSIVNWIQGHPNGIDEKGRIVSVFSWPDLNKLYFYKKKRNKRKYIQQESTLWRRSLWEKAGAHVSVKYKYAGDFELWMRFFQFDRIFNINAFIGSFRLSGAGQASIDHFDEYVKETYRILEEYPLTNKDREKLRAMERYEYLEFMMNRFFRIFKIKPALIDSTAMNNAIKFDVTSQKFVLKKLE
jgi:glycosyltransferase involved in cell wall biosynthesis